MALATNVLQAMAQVPVLAGKAGIECAIAPFGCTGTVAEDRIIVILADGTKLGTCANFVRHTTIVREAGAGSDAQTLFTWLIQVFQAQNPNRARGDKSPTTTLDLRPQARKHTAKAN